MIHLLGSRNAMYCNTANIRGSVFSARSARPGWVWIASVVSTGYSSPCQVFWRSEEVRCG